MRKRKSNLMLRLASLLLACVIISTYALCGLLARYTTSSSGSDSARVIAFRNLEVEEYGDFTNGTAVLIPGHDLIKDVVVEFGGSEASTIVFVELTLTEFMTGNGEEWVRDNNQFNLKMINSHKENENDDDYINALSFSVIGAELTNNPQPNTSKWYLLENASDGKYVYYKILSPNKQLVKDVSGDDVVDGSFIADGGKMIVDYRIPTITFEKDSTGNYIETKYDELVKTKISIKTTAVQANGFDSVSKAWDSIKNK